MDDDDDDDEVIVCNSSVVFETMYNVHAAKTNFDYSASYIIGIK